MLNGIAPVFLIYFPKTEATWVKNKDGSFSVKKVTTWKAAIPIYLDEELTGVYVDQNNEQLEISTENIVGSGEKKSLTITQKGDKQTVTVELLANKNSIGLNILLPLLKTLYDYTLKDKDYKIAYFNNNILIFDAKLGRYQKTEGRTNDLVAITIDLEIKPKSEEPKKEMVLEKGDTGEITTAYDSSPERTFTLKTKISNAAGTLTKEKDITFGKNFPGLVPSPKSYL